MSQNRHPDNDRDALLSQIQSIKHCHRILIDLMEKNALNIDKLTESILKTKPTTTTTTTTTNSEETTTTTTQITTTPPAPSSSSLSTKEESSSPSVVSNNTTTVNESTITTPPPPTTTTTKQKKQKNTKKNNLFATCRMRHVALRIQYDGSNYGGYAENVGFERPSSNNNNNNNNNNNTPADDDGGGGGGGDNSIEHHLFAALTKTCLVKDRYSCSYSRCGRTDKGVSAFGQVVGLLLRSRIPKFDNDDDDDDDENDEESRLPKNSYDSISINDKTYTELDYPRILNAILPSTIRVLGWCPVTPSFSARFSARDRTYRYHFISRKQQQQQLSVPRMREGLAFLEGTHDFRNFCKMDTTQVSNFVRTIHSARIITTAVEESNENSSSSSSSCCCCYFEIVGQAFLWHQIRCIVAIICLIGQNLEHPTLVKDLLDVKRHPAKPAYTMACDRPLVLHECRFRNLRMGYSCRNLFAVTMEWERLWEERTLEAVRYEDAVMALREVGEVTTRDVVGFCEGLWEERRRKRAKRRRRRRNGNHNDDDDDDDKEEEKMKNKAATLKRLLDDTNNDILRWNDALTILAKVGLRPLPQTTILNNNQQRQQKQRDTVISNDVNDPIHHIPLMERSRGTTYEEKVKFLKGKRKHRYEENIVKKTKSHKEDEDKAFYERMASQGGSGV